MDVLAYRDVLGYLVCVPCHDRLSNPGGMTVVLAEHVVQGRKCHDCKRDILSRHPREGRDEQPTRSQDNG